MGSQSSYYGDSPVQRNATGSPAAVTGTVTTSAQCLQKRYLVRIHRTWCLFLILSMFYVPLDRPSR